MKSSNTFCFVGFIDWLSRTRLHLDPCKANRVHEMRFQVKTYSNEWPSHMSGGVDNNRRLPSNLSSNEKEISHGRVSWQTR
jgi:hypothetical protein